MFEQRHPTLDKAASVLGVSDVTLWRCLKKPEFAEAFRKARGEAFSQSIARLQHASNAAMGTLLRVVTDREAPAASRVRIRPAARLRFANFLSGLTPGRLFQISTIRSGGHFAASLLSSFWLANCRGRLR